MEAKKLLWDQSPLAKSLHLQSNFLKFILKPQKN